ncbi:MAG TPA: ribulose-phosphate 3-epimerase [Gaiellaceae bacterium]|nr:ribulose-phosphate 3-epimerase [Gaiellaceae bacterium]
MPWRDWIRTVEVEPSLYAADFSRLGEQIETLMRAGARIFQFDVGDGHFVPPITIGPIVLQSISPIVHRLGGRLDCHLMVEHPERHFEAIAQAGGDSVTFHLEAVDDPAAVARQAREHELQVGLSFKPESEPEEAAEAADPFDVVLCMSIEPGYSGQPFMPEALGRIERLRSLLPDEKLIQVDGGVGAANVRLLREVGARLFVAGSSIFGRDDIARAYEELVAEAT